MKVARIAAALACTVWSASCGGSSDAPTLADEIADALEEEGIAADVACPDPLPDEEGAEFECRVDFEGGRGSDLTVRIANGSPTFDLSDIVSFTTDG